MATSRQKDLSLRFSQVREFFRNTESIPAIVNKLVEDTESEVSRIQSEIHALEQQRERWKKIAATCKPLASLIYRLSPEALSLIFAFACEENTFTRSKLPQTLAIYMVCGRWRNLILSTPSLWSHISVNLVKWRKDYQILHQLTTIFLERSRDSKLHLSLTLPGDNFGNDSTRAEAIPTIELLVANSNRWESLTLILTPPFFPLQLLRPIRGHMPALAHLLLRERDTVMVGFDKDLETLDLFEACPSLRSVEISASIFRPGAVRLPWPQVKTLKIRDSFSIDAYRILECENEQVESLGLDGVGGLFEGRDFPGDPVELPSLTSATLAANAQIDLDHFFRHTTLRNLSSLTIRIKDEILPDENDPQWYTHDSHTFMQQFIERSSCTITSLSLIGLPFTDVQTLALLRLFPSLESLTVSERIEAASNGIVTKVFLDGLTQTNMTITSTSTTPLPRLTHMKMVVHLAGLDIQALVEALTARWSPGLAALNQLSILGHVEMIVRCKPTDTNATRKSLDCLRCFKDAGMRLYITFTS